MVDHPYCKNHYSLRVISFITRFKLFRHVVIGFLLIAISNGIQAASDLGETDFLRLRKGETLVRVERSEGQHKGTVEAIILIDSPPEPIWRIMTDCDAAPSFVPGLAACRVLDSGDNWENIHHDVKWIWFLPRFSYVFRADYQINRQIDFTKIRGDLKEMSGSWRLEPLNNGSQTLVRYKVYLNPGFYIPQWVVRQSLKKNLPAVLIALRTKVQNSHWTGK